MGTKVKGQNSGKSKCRPCRPLDYIYDPDYVVSGSRDFHRCIAESLNTQAEFELCPLYTTMFSDAYPRYMMVLKRLDRLPPLFDRSWDYHQRAAKKNTKKPLDVDGMDRYRFFQRPAVPFLQPAVTTMTVNTMGTEEGKGQLGEYAPRIHNRSTQTDYRESETQTTPWAPPVFTHCTPTPEVLTLGNLSWGHGLPAGMHEVEVIERARIKRAWEDFMPTSGDPKSIQKMRNIIDAIERDECLFCEKEIQKIHNMRLDLACQLLKKSQHEETHKLNIRLQRYWTSKQQEKNRKIQKIRLDHKRALRKLALTHEGVTMKYREGSIVEEYRDHKSELYGPQMRFGEHPKRCHEVMNVQSRFLTHIKGLEILERVPTLLQPSLQLTKPAVKKKHELCVRETRWTEAVLEKLHQDLKNICRKTPGVHEHTGLISRLQKPIPVPETPSTEGVPDSEAENYQGAVFLQKVIKGRATQTLMTEGQHKWQELNEEMKSTTALHQEDLTHIVQQREHVQSPQQEQLQKERKDEWRTHTLALLAERESSKQETAEAGHKQKEEGRHHEHDEIFRQAVKVHQDTVDTYVEDLIPESTQWVAKAESQQNVRYLEKGIDKAVEEFHLRQNDLEQEEIVADLMHNYVVPEEEKQMICKHMKQRQAKYLKEAHASVYGDTQNLPPMTQPVSTGAENIRDSEKDEQPSTTDEGTEMTQQYSPEEEQQQQELLLVRDARRTLRESNRGAEEGATLVGRFHDSHEVGETFGTHTATTDYGEALETLGGIFSISENVDADADYSLQGPKDPTTKDEDEKLKPPGNEYTVSFKQPDSETEDTSSQRPKSKPNIGFREHDTGKKDDSSQHTKSNPSSGFWEHDKRDEDESTEHPESKPKITFREPDIGNKDNSTQHTE